jgi:hypothetical protein
MSGDTALILAVKKKKLDVVKVLCEADSTDLPRCNLNLGNFYVFCFIYLLWYRYFPRFEVCSIGVVV